MSSAVRRIAFASLRASWASVRAVRLATSSMVGGVGSLSSSASASASASSVPGAGPTGMPRDKRRFWAAWRDFFSSQRRSQG